MYYDPDVDLIAESGLIHIGFDEDGLPELMGTPEQFEKYENLTKEFENGIL